MNKLLLDCVRFNFTPIKPSFVALTSLHYNASSRTKTPSTYTPNPSKSCIQTCNHSSTAPRINSRIFFLVKAKGNNKTGLPTNLKWQIGLFLWQKPARREPERSAASTKRAVTLHRQVQGRSPWRAFGDFPRDGKVTRVPSMALPCSRGAPA